MFIMVRMCSLDLSFQGGRLLMHVNTLETERTLAATFTSGFKGYRSSYATGYFNCRPHLANKPGRVK